MSIMAFIWSYYFTYGLVFIIILLLLTYIINIVKFYKQFPVSHFILYLIYCKVFRKIPKDVPDTSFALKTLTEKCMQHMKEGICMCYTIVPILVIFGEELVQVFSNNKSASNKPGAVYHLIEDAAGAGLITINGEKWKSHRKLLNPAFSLGMLKDKVPLFNEHALAFVKDLEILVGQPSVDLLGFIKCHYFNALSESIFGLKQTEENRTENEKFFNNLDSFVLAAVTRNALPWLHWKFMLNTFSYGRKILRIHEELFGFTKNAILKMKQQMTLNETSDPERLSKNLRKSFTYVLLQHHLSDPSFTAEDLHGEVSQFMAAGYDTVSYATIWCLFMLGLHPEIQEKVFTDVQCESTTNYISYEDCSDFTYLEAVILETLRLYPVVPFFGRQLSQDVQCGELKIPKDTVIAFSPYIAHRNPDIYPDPETFNPERFSGSKKINSCTYMPFSEGLRNCIGKRYALLEMKIFLAYFLRNFKVTSLDRAEDIHLNWTVVLSPAKPLRMRIEQR